jgi:hypothetical protein
MRKRKSVVFTAADFRLLPSKAPRKKRAFIGPEAQLQIAVVDYLKLLGVKDLLYCSVPNEGVRSKQYGAKLKAMGLLPGAADLIICVPGESVGWLELKADRGRQTIDQRAFEKLVHFNGGRYAVARDIDEAMTVLKWWGAIR